MHTLIADTETNGFLEQMTCIHMLQIGEVDDDEVDVYADQPGFRPLKEGLERLKKADRVVFHNGTRFDYFAIEKIFPGTLRPEQIFDTVVAARLLFPEHKAHTLKDWGLRLNILKGDYTGGFEKFNPEMVVYGRQDIVVGRALYKHLLARAANGTWDDALKTENLFSFIISLQEQNGFKLNVEKVVALAAELRQEQNDLRLQLQEVFPPLTIKRVSKKTGKPLKDKIEVFNPGSGMQVANRLIAKYGWRPKKMTNTGRAAVDEAVLSSLRYPEAKLLLRYLGLQKMLGQIEDGDNGWLKLMKTETQRVHGAVNTLGAGTGRCSHFKPNMAQVSKKDLRMREVWEARLGWKLVGVDAEGIEFRMLSHYLKPFDGGATIETVLNGNRKLGTDIHSLNQKAGHLYDRDSAKTAIYALIYGAQDPKLGSIVIDDALTAKQPRPNGNAKSLGTKLRADLGKGTPGLDKLIKQVSEQAQRKGWLKAIDGRKIRIKSKHSAFNYLLQGGGAIVMKVALVLFHFNRVPAKGWVHGVDFAYCANVHDEVQSEVRPEIAEEFGKELADCIREAGEILGVRCPLAGSYDIGLNWKDTH
ncbi:MAG: DNA polymerase [Devosia sp.]|nr:DNA polymerase [Devosia sp.]